jgi:hypothetical protein
MKWRGWRGIQPRAYTKYVKSRAGSRPEPPVVADCVLMFSEVRMQVPLDLAIAVSPFVVMGLLWMLEK